MATCIFPQCVALLACCVVAPIAMSAAELGPADAVQAVGRVSAAETERESDVGTVICTRRYTLHNKRWEKEGTMTVQITSDARSGHKQYEILAMQAEGLQKKVFLKLLDAEVEGSASKNSESDTSITPANYTFSLAGTETLHGKEHLVVHLKPKRNSKYLLAGKAWIDPVENAIVRVEGQTARSVSFWIGKPQITQSFRKVEEIWVSESNRSVSDVKLIGRTELTIAFSDYKIIRQARTARTRSVRSGL